MKGSTSFTKVAPGHVVIARKNNTYAATIHLMAWTLKLRTTHECYCRSNHSETFIPHHVTVNSLCRPGQDATFETGGSITNSTV